MKFNRLLFALHNQSVQKTERDHSIVDRHQEHARVLPYDFGWLVRSSIPLPRTVTSPSRTMRISSRHTVFFTTNDMNFGMHNNILFCIVYLSQRRYSYNS